MGIFEVWVKTVFVLHIIDGILKDFVCISTVQWNRSMALVCADHLVYYTACDSNFIFLLLKVHLLLQILKRARMWRTRRRALQMKRWNFRIICRRIWKNCLWHWRDGQLNHRQRASANSFLLRSIICFSGKNMYGVVL